MDLARQHEFLKTLHNQAMKKFFALIALLFPPAAMATEGLALEVGAWSPYIDFSAPDQGIISAAVKKALAQVGIEARLYEVSWKAAEVRLDAGKTTSFAWIKNADRLPRWRFSAPICRTRTVVLTHLDRPLPMQSLADLKGKRVGWSRGYSYGDAMEALRAELRIEEMPTDEVALRHLLAGGIDAMPMDSAVARQLLSQRFTPEQGRMIVIDPSPQRTINYTELHLVCGVSDPECAKRITRFNTGLRALQGNTLQDCSR